MIIDITGTELTPGNSGRDCMGNGSHYDKNKSLIECCCNECDYMLCCIESFNENECKGCKDKYCPNTLGI